MSKLLRCVLIEDEPLAQELLERYVRRIPALDLIVTFDDALDALTKLPSLNPDLLFVDINMPELSGIEFLRTYPSPRPLTVMTTANPHHALDGFELGVVDYLLKPITFERFSLAIERVLERLPTPPEESDALYLKTDGQIERIPYDTIIFAEAFGDYVKVFLADRYVVSHLTLTKLTEALPADRFLRINRSYIVHRRSVNSLIGNAVIVETGHQLPIGVSYRESVKEQIRRWAVS